MPSPRKRIGYLPRSEVQRLIDKICIHNKLSQSKVTGILVEEALNSRGVLNSNINKLSFNFKQNINESSKTSNNNFKSDIYMNEQNIDSHEYYNNEEVSMINDYIKFKLFKKIINLNKEK
tara:strand:- start:106 stop:465 length:360 start_codon:yes stop_codon:yes gene_type:complete